VRTAVSREVRDHPLDGVDRMLGRRDVLAEVIEDRRHPPPVEVLSGRERILERIARDEPRGDEPSEPTGREATEPSRLRQLEDPALGAAGRSRSGR